MQNKAKWIICSICAVLFVLSIIGFVVANSQHKVIIKNDPKETPVVIYDDVSVTSNCTNIFLQRYDSRVDGTVYNISNQDCEVEIKIYVSTFGQGTRKVLTLNWQTIPAKSKLSLARTFNSTDNNYENVYKVTIQLKTGELYDAPAFKAITKTPFYEIPSIIIMVISGVLFGVILSRSVKADEDLTLDVDPVPIIINTPVADDSEESEKDTKPEDNSNLVECEYCGTLNDIKDKKCSCCGANLKKKGKKN